MRFWLLVANVLLMTFLTFVAAAITIVGETSIQGELALNAPDAQWITIFYLLGVNSMVPATTWLAERFGQKRMYLIGIATFTLTAGLLAVAPNFLTLGLGRLLEGFGAGIIIPVGLAILVRYAPKEKLSLCLNLYVAVGFGAGLGLGLPLSGYFAQFLSWRGIFWLIVPLGLLAFLECWLFHEPDQPQSVRKFDLKGYLAFIGFIACLLIALSFGALPSTNDGWTAPFILVLFGAAGIALLALFFIERKAEQPVLPLRLLREPLFVLSFLAMFLLGMALFSSLSSMTSFMLRALKYEKFVTSLIGSAYGIAMAAASVLTNQLVKKIPAPFLMLAGLSLLVISYFLNNQITLQSAPPQMIWILLMRGAGVGLSLAPLMGLGIRCVPPELQIDAATLLTFFRQVGGTYGGTVITILTIKRTIFHAARFSEQTNTQIPGYRVTWEGLKTQFFSAVSDKGILAGKQAKAAIVQNVQTQAFIQGLNDALMVFGWVTLVVTVLLATLVGKRMWDKRRAATQETSHPS